MTRTECIRELQAEYHRRRMENEQEAEARYDAAVLRDPEIARLREENASLAINTMKRISTMADETDRRNAALEMREKGRQNNNEIAERLRALGLPEDHLSVRYHCRECRDTGLVGDAPSRFCACFEQALRMKLYEDGSMADVNKECFETFDANRIPEEGGQRMQLIAARDFCELYADSFPETRFKNILLTGAGGLGKTFLLNCIFARVIENGGEAVRVTAYRMFEAMRRKYFADGGDEKEFDNLLSVPLLLIDDLGSEPMMRNITVESLFILFNERTLNGKHTVIATNLTPIQIQERYGERVLSRMVDRSHCAAIRLTGKDLRKQ